MKSRSMIAIVTPALTLILCLTAAAADEKAAALLAGKWVPASGSEKGTFVEFGQDGVMTYTFGKKEDMTYHAAYKVINDATIEIKWDEETLKKNNLLSKEAKRAKYAISGDRLTFDPILHNIKKIWKREK